MSTPDISQVPPHILEQMANLKPYVLLLLYKGANYGTADAARIIQSEHLPYLFELRAQGIVLLSMPVLEDADVTAIAIYNSRNKEEVQPYVENDPAVRQGVFRYQLLSSIGMPGDVLA